VLAGVLHGVAADGLVMYRYAKPGARDYLAAWLRHLAWCAAFPDGSQRTLWLGDGERFVLGPVADASVQLAGLLALYRVGRCMPLRFFPRSAWKLVTAGEAAAQASWRSDRYRAEAEDPAVMMALRGRELLFENEARELAHAVFDPVLAHLVDEEGT
jgi:exodeoxyribonuclease V gamma subunit